MSRRTKIYASLYKSEPLYADIEKGEAIRFSVDWGSVLGILDTGIASADWAQDQSAYVEISDEVEDSGVTSAMLTALHAGKTVITQSVTLDNGETREKKFVITVNDSR